MVFWESVSIGAGHIAPVMLSVWFLYPSLKIQYSPLVPTNIHPCTQPWIVIRSQRHPRSLCLRSLPTPGPWIAMDQIVCRYIFSRSRRRRWWPFSPVVAGAHQSAQRPALRPQTDKTKPKSAGFTMNGFLFLVYSCSVKKTCWFNQQSSHQLRLGWVILCKSSSGQDFYEFH